MTAITEEALSVSGVLLAKVFNRQADEVRRYKEENARQVDLQVRQAMTGQSFFAVVQTFLGVTPALVYLVAGILIVVGSGAAVTAGTIVAFTTLQTRLLFPTVNLLRVSLDVQTSLALFGRIFSYLDLVPRIVDAPERAGARRRVRHRSGGARARLVRLPARPQHGACACGRRAHLGRARRVVRRRAGATGRDRRPQRRRQDHPVLPRATGSTTWTGAGC